MEEQKAEQQTRVNGKIANRYGTGASRGGHSFKVTIRHVAINPDEYEIRIQKALDIVLDEIHSNRSRDRKSRATKKESLISESLEAS